MRKLSKNQKIILGIFFGVLGLMCFHPIGRMIVKIILPLGLGIIDLIGTCFLILFLMFVFLPQLSDLWRSRRLNKRVKQSNSNNSDVSDKISLFIYRLVQLDKENKYVPSFMKVIEVGKKRNQQILVQNFLNYYGQQTIKFLDAQIELSSHNPSPEIDDTLKNISRALDEIKQICNNFISKLIDDDLLDIDVDITVLGRISASDKLKN